MSIKNKIIFTLFFIISLTAAVMGISILTKNGGPCNGGILLLFLATIFIICSLLLLSPFAALIKKSPIHFKTELTISVIVFVIWSICIMLFTDPDTPVNVLYLVPLDFFSIITTIILIKLKERITQ